ncbi:SARP family transcriptional regulator [Occultella glacieicola]|uniref:SARP family transcriptional regulator n=1 Tax=Occultella glacieicola TaxID=2518684 RepID=A0ABY2E5K0_9MICO|nr:BTAD domain-containing putative transcriptional regulator [Occultella glacieicola]TDE95871.1 SARP family transcriptional regulator [Occultella glacieicola]
MTGRIRLLGQVEVDASGRAVDLGPARQRAVLAILLLDAPRPVGTDDLVERLWGMDPPPGARQSLRAYVCRLRQILGAAPVVQIERRGGGYGAQVRADEFDLALFRRLVREAAATEDALGALATYRRALDLWPAAALGGVDSLWLAARRDALRLERHGVELDHNDIALAVGAGSELVAPLTALAAADPYDERVLGQLMLALHGCGRSTEALGRFHAVGRLLRDELGTEPGPPLRSVHERILRGEAAPTTPRPATGTPDRRDAVVPHQLPPATGGFVGRAAETAALDAALLVPDGGSSRFVVLSGPGGVGKTALAVHWARAHAGTFEDGELFVDLRGFDPEREPLSTESALRGLVLALGADPAAVPSDLGAITGLFRSLAGSRRLLVIADDARCSEQVRALLPPGPGSVLIATSRSRLAGLVGADGARPVPVTVMGSAESRALLSKRLGAGRVAADPVSVDALVRHCAGLPLALAIVAAQATMQPDLPLRDLAAELGEDDERLDGLCTGESGADLRAALEASVGALAPAAARAFALLGLATGRSITSAEIEALTGSGRVAARALTRDLLAHHLLERDVPGRFRMHDLVRLHAVGLGRSHPEAGTARRALLEHYRAAGPTGAADAGAVLAAVDLAVAAGADELVCALTGNLDRHLRKNGCWRELVRVHGHARDAATHLGDDAALTRAQIGLGIGLIGQRNFTDAAPVLGAALDLAARVGDVDLLAAAHRANARWAAQQGRHDVALHHDERVLDLALRTGDRLGEATARNAIGWHQAHLGRPAQGLFSCRAALAILEEDDLDPTQLAATLDSIGYALDLLGRHPEAQEHYRRSAAVAEQQQNVVLRAESLRRLATSYARIGSSDLAERAERDAAAVLRRAGLVDDDPGIAHVDHVDAATSRATGGRMSRPRGHPPVPVQVRSGW